MERLIRTIVFTVVAAGLVLQAGCGSGAIANPQASLDADESSAAFLDRLSSQQTVNENDAMRGMLILLDGQDNQAAFSERVEQLRSKDIIDPDWDVDACKPLTRGRLAYMIYQATDMPGGVMLTLTGPSERYCLRELQYRRMMGNGSLFAPVTGLEYVGVLTRADVYIRSGQVPVKSGELPRY